MREFGTVTVLAGGDSPEREVSLHSGEDSHAALLGLGIDSRLLVVDDVADLRRHLGEIEVAFSCLHGGAGEDGTVQAILEENGILYAGPGPEASALGMDKLATKERLAERGLTVPQAMVYADGEGDLSAFCRRVLERFGLPVVAKPLSQGASIGVRRLDSVNRLRADLEAMHAQFGPLLVEEYIVGRELTTPVLWMDGEDDVLPIVEMVIKTDFFDYRTKVSDGLCEDITPAPLDPRTTAAVERVTLEAHRALGCWGFSRVDVLLTEEGTPYVLEVNTLPGLTKHSAMPKSAAAAGLDFPHLIVAMLETAFHRPG
jgi:D-alanine-D-alanine ligase